jgi:tRNA(fMet)-specific endonuclease VapC
MFLLDTNIISELIKKRPNQSLLDRLVAVPPTSLCTASVCLMELRYGSLRVPNGDALWNKIQKLVLAKLQIMSFGYKEALKAADLLAELYAIGQPIGVEDIMIASIALSNGLTVVSANTKHFSRISGLSVENWLHPD